MNQTVERLDRLIANLRDEQQELMEMYDTLEMEINQLEKEADRLEALSNDVSVCNDDLTYSP
jgi:prefoldin subunit 5